MNSNPHSPVKPSFGPPLNSTFTDKFCQNFCKLWMNDSTADIFFVIDTIDQKPRRIPAHKCLLAADSSVFYRRFFIDLNDASDIAIFDVTIDSFQVFLSSFYQPNILITDQNISELIYLAKQYDARNCMSQCEHFLKAKLTAENVCYAFELATLCNDMDMYRSCLMVIETNFLRVLASDGFLYCTHNVLKHILLSNIRNRNEFAMFEACMHWAKTSCERKHLDNPTMLEWRTELAECFDLIRFGSMTPLQFMKCETIYPIFSTKELTEIKLRIIARADNELKPQQ